MTSSTRSSPFRIEPGPPLATAGLLAAGGALAGSALMLSSLTPGAAVLLWLGAAGASLVEWRRRVQRRPIAIELQAPDMVRLEWRDGRVEEGRLRGWRRLGPIVLLDIDGDRRCRFALRWPSGSLNDARRLSRQLARMHPVSGLSV